MLEELLELGEGALWEAAVLAGAVTVGLAVHVVLFAVLGRITRRTGSELDDSFYSRMRSPARVLAPLVVVLIVVPLMDLPEASTSLARHVLVLGIIAAVGWLALSLTHVADDMVASQYPLDVDDNLQARQVHTQVRVLRKVAGVFVVVLTIAIMLTTFPGIRELGASLLASAGLAGIVVGMAARPTLSNLVAGVQLAMTQPIRIDDVVIVEGEWGRIEEIRTTFVVVRIWDARRLIVPLSYFIEKPIENWTRKSADILGTVYVYADYTVPVGAIREKLHEILRASEEWDGASWGLQVTNASPETLELRAVMSAPDSGAAWNLRCRVREELVRYLEEEHPQALPRARAEIRTAGLDGGDSKERAHETPGASTEKGG